HALNYSDCTCSILMAVYRSPYCLSQPPTKLIEEVLDFADADAMNDYRIEMLREAQLSQALPVAVCHHAGERAREANVGQSNCYPMLIIQHCELRDGEDIASILETDNMKDSIGVLR
ncbi:hypothetical protein FOZ63_001745, partial [Perkinsus olseni]